MKKVSLVLVLVVSLLLLVGCKKEYSDEKWEEETFFDSVYVPKGTVNKLSQDYNNNGKESYSVFVNEFSYEDFYEYIMALEADGFNYEFVNAYVPKDINNLPDKTETSWAAHKDDIYIIANWRDKENTYHDGYDLQLLFYNYDYTQS